MLCWSPYEAALFEAAFSLMFFGAFCPSELLCSLHFDTSSRVMMREDIEFQVKKVVLHLSKSKTDQWVRGMSITLSRSTDNSVCLVRLLQAFLQFRGDELLLIHTDGSPLTLSQFHLVFNRGLMMLGLCPTEFGLHSLRIGAASTAAHLGMPNASIQRTGRWRSAAFKSYVCK